MHKNNLKAARDMKNSINTQNKNQTRMIDAYGRLPLSFVSNHGQTDDNVKFLSHGHGYTLFLTSNEIVLSLDDINTKLSEEKRDLKSNEKSPDKQFSKKKTLLSMRFKDSNLSPKVYGLDKLLAKNNYFIGSDRTKWIRNTPNYAKVKYEEIYPGIDLVFYGNKQELEYDFIVKPDASPETISMIFEGAENLSLDKNNNLLIKVEGKDVILKAPIIYQLIKGKKQIVTGNYVLSDNDAVNFHIASYDKKEPLVIDPTLVYSTLIGGSGSGSIWYADEGRGIAVDTSGNAYITGETQDVNFPTTSGAYNTSFPGGSIHIFVSKLNASGSQLEYSTYIGGTNADMGRAIDVDDSGNVYITGETWSDDFPVTTGVVQSSLSGTTDAFVLKLNSTGSSLLYSTFLGGSEDDEGMGIVVDDSGYSYITGHTQSNNMPGSSTSIQAQNAGETDAFVVILDPSAQSVTYATYLGGSGHDWGYAIAVDKNNDICITGQTRSTNFPTTPLAFGMVGKVVGTADSDAFVSKIDLEGAPPNIGVPSLAYSTYLGGSSTENQTYGVAGIAVDSSGNIYVTGETKSNDFPTTTGAYQTVQNGIVADVFVTKINPSGGVGNDLVYSTYLGGEDADQGMAITVDSKGQAYVIGNTNSSDFPIWVPTQSSFGNTDTTIGGDAFVTALNSSGTGLLYSTFLGGSGGDHGHGITLDTSGNIYVTGETSFNRTTLVSSFPVTGNSIGTTGGLSDVFVAKISSVIDLDIDTDIKANGSDGPVTINTATKSSDLQLTLDLDPNDNSSEADWWVVVSTPSNSWQYYNLSTGWTSGIVVTYQGTLMNLDSYNINFSGLSTGTYTFYFGVDLIQNGSLDLGTSVVYYDFVTVNVQ